MAADIHDSPSAFSSLAGTWRSVLDGDPSASVFHTPQYLATWWGEFGGGLDLRVIEVRDAERTRGIAAMVLSQDGVLRFAGDHDTTDYRGPVSALEDREMVAAALVEAIEGEPWTTFELDGIAADTGWTDALASAAKAAGHAVAEEQPEACPRVELAGTYDGYLASLPGKLRHEIQRKARRLERDGGPFGIRFSTEATLDDDLDLFFAMHRSSDGPKGRFMHEGMASFFGNFAWMLHSQGWLRLAVLEIGGEAWAGAYSFSFGGSWGVWNSAYDHRRRELAPGMVLVGECIRIAVEEGCATFDFLRGTEPYKYRFGAVDTPLIRMTVRRG